MSAEPRIVHVDDDVLVVDVPAGLVVHPAPSHTGPTLVDWLGERAGGGEAERPGIVHRLDRDTSGLLVVARNAPAHASLSRQVKERTVERRYIALVAGRVRSRTGTIDAPLGRDQRARERVVIGGRGRREARTHFEVTELLAEDTLLDVRLETGRTHQIRVHLASIGHPVVGDPTYGEGGRHGLHRQFLHAARLAFDHPATGERVHLESELPADLRAALERARAL